MHKLFMAALVAVFLAGCQSTPTTDESAAPIDDKSAASGATTAGTGTAGAATSGVTGSAVGGSGAGTGAGALRDPNSILSKRSIYFEFDSFVVRDEFRPVVEAHAKYLAANKGARLTIQGHADERGSREYNIALGQRRADAVKRMMTLQGAQDSQIETVSFGEEKPRNAGHDEAAWAENRRADLIYAGE